MTNREYMLGLRVDDCYSVMDWLMHEYGMRYTSTRHAVCNWLESEAVIGQWKRVTGYMTPGGDPVWKCGKCGGTEHVCGIETQYNRRVLCLQCGHFNVYDYGGHYDAEYQDTDE